MTKRTYSHTNSGDPSTDDGVEILSDEAERGYDVEEIIGRRGKRSRPRLGSAPSTVEAVRLDPEPRHSSNDEPKPKACQRPR